MVVGALGFVALVGLLLGTWPVVAKQMGRPRGDRSRGGIGLGSQTTVNR
jgi:hypothetical protein